MPVGASKTPFPKKFRTKFKYCDTFSISQAAYYEYLLRLNSLYDFDYTSTGH